MGEKPIKNKRISERDNEKILQALFDISQAFSSTQNLKELALAIQNSLEKWLNLKYPAIALWQHENRSIEQIETDRGSSSANEHETETLCRLVIEAKASQRLTQPEIRQALCPDSRKDTQPLSRVWLGVPLLIGTRVIGIIIVRSHSNENDYQDTDLMRLNAISRHIALAVDQKARDERLAEQQEILKRILESSPVGIALVQDRIFKWVNNEMIRMFGFEGKDELEDKSVQKIYCSIKDYELAGKMIYMGLSSVGSAEYDIELKRKDGSRFPAHIRLNSRDTANPMAWTIATIFDISQRKAAQSLKSEKEKLNGVFEMAEAVIHEIHAPLQQVIRLIDRSQEKEGLTGEEVRRLKSEALKIGKITKRLTNITHYKTKQTDQDIRIVDIWGSTVDHK